MSRLGSIAAVGVLAFTAGCQGGGESALGQRPTSYPAAGEQPSATGAQASRTDAAGRRALLAQARTAAEAALSYDHRTFDQDVARARGLMTPAFQRSYDRLVASLRANATEQVAHASAVVVTGAISGAEADRAQAILFVDQRITRSGHAVEATGSVAVVTMVRSDSRWLMGSLETTPPQDPIAETRPVPGAVLAAGAAVADAYADLGWEHPAADVERVLALSTGGFRKAYADAAPELVRRTLQSRTTQEASVIAAGLRSLRANRAVVLVGLSGTTRVGSAAPTQRTVRLEVELTRSGASWLASALRVIPAPA